jgi:hypothetical protein
MHTLTKKKALAVSGLSWQKLFTHYYDTIGPMNCIHYMKFGLSIYIPYIILTAAED